MAEPEVGIGLWQELVARDLPLLLCIEGRRPANNSLDDKLVGACLAWPLQHPILGRKRGIWNIATAEVQECGTTALTSRW